MHSHPNTLSDAISSVKKDMEPNAVLVQVAYIYFPRSPPDTVLAIRGFDLNKVADNESGSGSYYIMRSQNGRWHKAFSFQEAEIIVLHPLQGQTEAGIERPDSLTAYPVMRRKAERFGSLIEARYTSVPPLSQYRASDMVPIDVIMSDGENEKIYVRSAALERARERAYLQPGDAIRLYHCIRLKDENAPEGRLVSFGMKFEHIPTTYTLIVQDIFSHGFGQREPMYIVGLARNDPKQRMFVYGAFDVISAIKAEIGSAHLFREAAADLLNQYEAEQRKGVPAEKQLAKMVAALVSLRKKGPRPILEIEAQRTEADILKLTSRNWRLSWDPPIRRAIQSIGDSADGERRPVPSRRSMVNRRLDL